LVIINLTGGRQNDFDAANRKRAGNSKFTLKKVTAAQETGFTWHHHEVMGIMELVEARTHPHAGGIGHKGGAAVWSAVTGISYKNSITKSKAQANLRTW